MATLVSSADSERLSPRPRVSVKPLRIGPLMVDPPVLQAPMAGFTNYAYRQVVREFGGAGLQATEMVSAHGFLGQRENEGDCPTGCGAWLTSRGRWRCRCGITIRAGWPPWREIWPTSCASAWWTSISAAR